MKVEVGKTYKTKGRKEVYIEGILKYPRSDAYPFLGTIIKEKMTEEYNEKGECAYDSYRNDLVPNTVKKEGWVIRYRWKNEGSPRSSVDIYAYPNKEDAETRARTWDKRIQYSIHKIEWEEEET